MEIVLSETDEIILKECVDISDFDIVMSYMLKSEGLEGIVLCPYLSKSASPLGKVLWRPYYSYNKLIKWLNCGDIVAYNTCYTIQDLKAMCKDRKKLLQVSNLCKTDSDYISHANALRLMYLFEKNDRHLYSHTNASMFISKISCANR